MRIYYLWNRAVSHGNNSLSSKRIKSAPANYARDSGIFRSRWLKRHVRALTWCEPAWNAIFPTAFSPRFAQQYPDECCPKQKHFLSLSCRASGRHIDESVSLLFLAIKFGDFKETGVSNDTHRLYWHRRCSALCYTSVGYCLFVSGYAKTYRQINERLHTFLF